MRIRTMIALAVLGALAVVVLAIPAMAHDDNHRTDHPRSGAQHPPSLGSGGKLTFKLLERGEQQTLAAIYASADTGGKVKRAMRRGLSAYCFPEGYDTLGFTCELQTPTPLTTVPQTTLPQTTLPQTTVPTTTP